MHSKLLSTTSEFFKAKIKPEWLLENESIKLPHHEYNVFDIYVVWLYNGGDPTMPDMNREGGEKRSQISTFQVLAEAYVLGEILIDYTFKNAIMDTWLKMLKGTQGDTFYEACPEMARVIYDGTLDGSPARKFIVDVLRCTVDGPQLTELLDKLPDACHHELTISFATERKTKAIDELDFGRCRYHKH